MGSPDLSNIAVTRLKMFTTSFPRASISDNTVRVQLTHGRGSPRASASRLFTALYSVSHTDLKARSFLILQIRRTLFYTLCQNLCVSWGKPVMFGSISEYAKYCQCLSKIVGTNTVYKGLSPRHSQFF
jgi:hypothetical protein